MMEEDLSEQSEKINRMEEEALPYIPLQGVKGEPLCESCGKERYDTGRDTGEEALCAMCWERGEDVSRLVGLLSAQCAEDEDGCKWEAWVVTEALREVISQYEGSQG